MKRELRKVSDRYLMFKDFQRPVGSNFSNQITCVVGIKIDPFTLKSSDARLVGYENHHAEYRNVLGVDSVDC